MGIKPALLSPRARAIVSPAILITLITLAVTVLGGYVTQQALNERMRDFFNRQADQIASTYYNKLNAQVTILEALRALWNTNGSFSQKSFNTYLDSLVADTLDHSGVSSYVYITAVENNALGQFEKEMRRETIRPDVYREYTVHPASTQAYYPFVYIYPLSGRESAIGLDFSREALRLDAITYARDHNALATTKPLVLQTTGKLGFFFLLPLYQPGLPVERSPERKAAFTSFVGLVYRSDTAFRQIFGGEDPYPYLDFQVYQGAATTSDRLLYDHDESFTAQNPRFQTTRLVRLYDQTWTIQVQTKDTFSLGEAEQRLPVYVFAGGLVMTLLLVCYSFYSLTKIYLLPPNR